jgi:hypothetical protein
MTKRAGNIMSMPEYAAALAVLTTSWSKACHRAFCSFLKNLVMSVTGKSRAFPGFRRDVFATSRKGYKIVCHENQIRAECGGTQAGGEAGVLH